MTDRTAAVISMAWAGALLAALWQFVPAVWDDTDDLRMAMIAGGIGAPDGPDSILLYMHVIIGSILSRLYTALPVVPWYTWMLIGIHLLSVACLSFTALAAGLRTVALSACAVLQIAVTCYFWTHLQFTTSAAVLALAGLSLLTLGLSRTADSNRTRLLICGGLCLTGSSLIRLQSTQLVIILSGICVLITVWKFRPDFRPVKDSLILAVSALLLLGGTIWQNSTYQATPELASFHKDLIAYAPIVNSIYLVRPSQADPDAGGHPDEDRKLAELGLRWNDIRCMQWWYMIDEDVFSSDNLAALAQVFPVLGRVDFFISIVSRGLPGILLGNNLFLLFVGTGIGLLLSHEPSTRQTVLCLLLWGLAVVVMAVVLCAMKLPERVFIPAGMTCFMMTLLSCTILREHRNQQDTESGLPDKSVTMKTPARRPRGQIWLSVMTLLAACVAIEHVSFGKQLVRQRDGVEQTIEQLNHLEHDLHVVLVPFPFQLLDPLRTPELLRDWNFIYLDGHQRSPRQQKIIHAHLGQTLSEAVLENPDIRFVVEPEARSLRYIQTFYRSHYGLDVRFPIDRMLPWGSLRRLEQRPAHPNPDTDSNAG
ncbi:MAG: hypothetical protein VB858_20075, partial [Planctomycetaceae bacterium]